MDSLPPASAPKRRRLEGGDGLWDSGDASALGSGGGGASTPRTGWCRSYPEYVAPASAAITLCVGAHAFAPTFTHQQFDDEVIFGYRDPRLTIRYGDPAMTAVTATLHHRGGLPPDAIAAGVAPDDVAARLRASLPDGTTVRVVVRADDDGECDATPTCTMSEAGWRPPGACVATYTTTVPDGHARRFVIHRWQLDTPQLQAYHDAMATLAMWLIENASPIDLKDPRWWVYGTYEEHDAAAATMPHFSLVAFMTVYRFTNPFQKPRPCTLRLAQLVTLPPYQRQRHGHRLMTALYGHADGDDAVMDVTVESPCHGMSRLRDAVDVGRAVSKGAFAGWAGWAGGGDGETPTPPADPAPLIQRLTPAQVRGLRDVLRVTAGQAHRVYEALLLAHVIRWVVAQGAEPDDAGTGAAWDGLMRPYRLLVKRRVLEGDEELQAVEDGEARKAALETEYAIAVGQYASALATCGLITRRQAAPWIAKGATAAVAEVEPGDDAVTRAPC